MHTPDELADADADAAHRRDIRRTVLITSIALVLVLATSVLLIVGGASA